MNLPTDLNVYRCAACSSRSTAAVHPVTETCPAPLPTFTETGNTDVARSAWTRLDAQRQALALPAVQADPVALHALRVAEAETIQDLHVEAMRHRSAVARMPMVVKGRLA